MCFEASAPPRSPAPDVSAYFRFTLTDPKQTRAVNIHVLTGRSFIVTSDLSPYVTAALSGETGNQNKSLIA